MNKPQTSIVMSYFIIKDMDNAFYLYSSSADVNHKNKNNKCFAFF